jgi:putative transposase
MPGRPTTQTLSYDVRLPKEAQEDALRLLDASRAVVNATLTLLWPSLDAFATGRTSPAWKQVAEYMGSPDPHGDRQWRCESETAGRILRAQATRKRAFTLIQPLLTDGFIFPKTDRKPASKNRRAITAAITALRHVQAEAASGQEDGESTFVALQNIVEQCCNYYLQHDRFPDAYEEMQAIPVLKVGLLTYAGDDGPDKGQSFGLRLALEEGEAGVAYLRFRCPDTQGVWGWRPGEVRIDLPERLREQLRAGAWQAPTLREEQNATGARTAVLDIPVAVEPAEPVGWERVERVLGADWGVHTLLTATAVDTQHLQVGRPFFLKTGGFDGRQARTRRQIDELTAKKKRYEQARDALPHAAPDPMHPAKLTAPLDSEKAGWYTRRIAAVEDEITRCWRKYNLRNRTLAHLAANVLLLLCHLHGCSLLAMESLETLKTTGRGRGVRGRWRNYRNNSTIRGEIWRLLRYKCRLAGIRFHTARPEGTSHTCPRCGASVDTCRSPQDAQQGREAVDWGRWLWCASCQYNGDRDYAAAVNIARLGVAMLLYRHHTGMGRAFVLTDPEVKPTPYTDVGSALLLPPTGLRPARAASPQAGTGRGTICYLPGWYRAAFLQSSLPQAVFPRLRRQRSAA